MLLMTSRAMTFHDDVPFGLRVSEGNLYDKHHMETSGTPTLFRGERVETEMWQVLIATRKFTEHCGCSRGSGFEYPAHRLADLSFL
jgi:hypothetical protein